MVTTSSGQQKYLISCSLDTCTNMVIYKGQNYPVGAVGARFWPCDENSTYTVFHANLSDVTMMSSYIQFELCCGRSNGRDIRGRDQIKGTITE
ncbi:unnamed protein product [Absidia cylindrospora]